MTDMADLLTIETGLRNEAWEDEFFRRLVQQKVNIIYDEPKCGPDGFSYLLADISTGFGEPAGKVLDWLSHRGIGLVVNPRKAYPDYVFTYGMVWNWRETGEFFLRHKDRAPAAGSSDRGLWTASLFEGFLPSYARNHVREFLRQNGMPQPRVILLGARADQLDLVFALESLGKPKSEDLPHLAEAVGWFLPGHYGVSFIDEQSLSSHLANKIEFVDL